MVTKTDTERDAEIAEFWELCQRMKQVPPDAVCRCGDDFMAHWVRVDFRCGVEGCPCELFDRDRS